MAARQLRDEIDEALERATNDQDIRALKVLKKTAKSVDSIGRFFDRLRAVSIKTYNI